MPSTQAGVRGGGSKKEHTGNTAIKAVRKAFINPSNSGATAKSQKTGTPKTTNDSLHGQFVTTRYQSIDADRRGVRTNLPPDDEPMGGGEGKGGGGRGHYPLEQISHCQGGHNLRSQLGANTHWHIHKRASPYLCLIALQKCLLDTHKLPFDSRIKPCGQTKIDKRPFSHIYSRNIVDTR